MTAVPSGTVVNAYNKGTAVAVAAVSNHDYTVTTGTTLTLSAVWGSASGRAKIEVSIETGVGTGTYTTIFTGFTSPLLATLVFPVTAQVGAGIKVRIVRTNVDAAAQDLYSTIVGKED